VKNEPVYKQQEPEPESDHEPVVRHVPVPVKPMTGPKLVAPAPIMRPTPQAVPVAPV